MVRNVREVLEELGYGNITEHPKEYRTAPIYRESNNYTVLSVRKDSGRWIDYALGATGDLADLVQITLKLKDVEESILWLKQRNIHISARVPQEAQAKITTPEIFDKESLLRLSDDTSYWESRGVSVDLLKRFGGGLAYKGKMAGRYVFPVYNSRNDIVGFAGRDIFNNSERMKWKLLGSKDKWVYPAFLNYELLQRERVVILVESIGDCLALFHAGIENVLVTFGISLSSGLLNFLIKTDFRYIFISLNNDQTKGKQWGNQAAEKMKSKLLRHFDTGQVNIALPDKKDFGEMTIEEIQSWKKKGLCQPAV